MQKESPKKQIFQTQPKVNLPSYDLFLKQIKNYTFNLNHHLNQAINDQNKSIKRKRIELEKQLEYLKQKHFTQRKKIRQMEQYFTFYCQNPLKNDINKWIEHQNYFKQIFEQYYNEVQIQTLINDKNRQKIAFLRSDIKQKMKQDYKQAISQKLQLEHLSKSKNFRTKKSFSTKLERKSTKMNTQPSQATDLYDFNKINFSKNLKRHTQADQNQLNNISRQTQELISVKTQMSLPALKNSVFLDPKRIKNDDFSFMKPIGTIKKGQSSNSILPELIRFFQQYRKKLSLNQSQMDWFQKVVFNNRNFDKLIDKFNEQFKQISDKKPINKSQNKVKQLVAKNLFRLKTQSTIETNQSKFIKQKQTSNKKRILSFIKNQSNTQRLMH